MPTTSIGFFDTWRPLYGGAVVYVRKAGSTDLADIYTDEALSAAAANPQTLLTLESGGVSYGKWTVPLYTEQAYWLDIDNGDQSGINRPPLTTLDGQDASDAVVTTTAGTRSRALDDRFDDFIHAEDYGVLDDSDSATNTTTLTAAIGAAASNSGGRVLLPPGSFPFTSLTLSTGVVLEGAGRGITTIQCQTAGDCVTLSGDKAGLARLTLDGVNNTAGGVGVASKANDEIVLQDVEVKRFETGLHFKGGRRAAWENFYIDTCGTGLKGHGDNDAGGGADGDEFRNNSWVGGLVQNCTVIGVDLSFEDKKAYQNTIQDVGFKDNTAIAVNINGARYTHMIDCWWDGNTTNIAVADDDDTDNASINTVHGLYLHGGSIVGGAATFTDTCQDVVLQGMEISDVDFTLTLPTHPILLQDCDEDNDVTISGDGTKYTRVKRRHDGSSYGLTTDATATKAWSITLEPGQVGYLDARVLGNQRNDVAIAQYHRVAKVSRPGSELDYDGQSADFTLGDILTGSTSGATARIVGDSDSGATGTLTLRDIEGEFLNNETITDTSGGEALANGTLTHQDCVVDQADTLGTDHEDVAGWNAAFAANGAEIELRVTGAADDTIEWNCHVKSVLD